MTGRYPLPEELSRYAPGNGPFAPEELREVCRVAGEGLGGSDAEKARFRSAAQMVLLWKGLDLPAWEAPYVIRDTRLGYLAGYEEALLCGRLAAPGIFAAAEARWGDAWREKLDAARQRRTEG